jgi:hypothetical protein
MFKFFLLLVFVVGVTLEFGHERVQEVNIQYGGWFESNAMTTYFQK